MICNCKHKGRLVQFETFQYWFCDVCKKEIELEKVSNNSAKPITKEEPAFEINLDNTLDKELITEFEKFLSLREYEEYELKITRPPYTNTQSADRFHVRINPYNLTLPPRIIRTYSTTVKKFDFLRHISKYEKILVINQERGRKWIGIQK